VFKPTKTEIAEARKLGIVNYETMNGIELRDAIKKASPHTAPRIINAKTRHAKDIATLLGIQFKGTEHVDDIRRCIVQELRKLFAKKGIGKNARVRLAGDDSHAGEVVTIRDPAKIFWFDDKPRVTVIYEAKGPKGNVVNAHFIALYAEVLS